MYNDLPTISCVNRHCSREALPTGRLCAICSDTVGVERAATAIVNGPEGDRILRTDAATARRRARLAIAADAKQQEQAAAQADLLMRTAAKYGDDAVQDAFLAALERGAPDPMAAAANDARGKLSNTLTTAKRRAGIEFKYCSHWAPSDPTGNAAAARVDKDTDSTLLLAADTFTFTARGRNPLRTDWEGLAAATNTDAATIKSLVVGELLASGARGTRENGQISTDKHRAKHLDTSINKLRTLEGLALADRAPRVKPATMVAVNKPARVLAPVVGTGRIK